MYKPGTEIGKYVIIGYETTKHDPRIKAYLCFDLQFYNYCYITPNAMKWIERCQPVYQTRHSE